MRLIASILLLFIGALVCVIPNMTRRGILFAVPVPAAFRDSEEGRRAMTEYRVLIAILVLAGICGALLLPHSALAGFAVAAPVVILLIATLGFYWERHKLMPFEVQHAGRQKAELTNEPDRVPRFTWLAGGPFAILAIAAVFLRENWERIPSRFPIHWGIDGQPNGWNERTAHGVYGPLLFAAVLCVWLLIMGLATWFDARRSRLRRIVLGAMIGAEYMLAILFSALSVQPVLHIPIWIPVLLPLLFIAPTLIVMWRNVAGPSSELVEATPNDAWSGGVWYYNPRDPALFVEKRIGLGYTLNFGNRWSWVLLLGLVAIVACAFALL